MQFLWKLLILANSFTLNHTLTHRMHFFPNSWLKQLTLFFSTNLFLQIYFDCSTNSYNFCFVCVSVVFFVLFFIYFFFFLKYETRIANIELEININLNVYCGTKSHVFYYSGLWQKSIRKIKKIYIYIKTESESHWCFGFFWSFSLFRSLCVCVCLCDFIVVLTLNFFLYCVVSHTQQLHSIWMKAEL